MALSTESREWLVVVRTSDTRSDPSLLTAYVTSLHLLSFTYQFVRLFVVCTCVCSYAHDDSTATQRDTQVDLGRTTCRHVLRAERSKVKAAGSKCHNILIVMPKLLMIEFCLIISCLLSPLDCCSQFYDLHTRNNFLLTKLLVVDILCRNAVSPGSIVVSMTNFDIRCSLDSN